jgi:hypothetical protein
VHAVGEQHRELGEVGRGGHDLAVRSDVDQSEETVTDEHAADQEKGASGEHCACRQARQQHRRQQRGPEHHHEQHAERPDRKTE